MSKKNLESLRASIRSIDDEILRLVARRMELAREIGKVKLTGAIPVHDPAREAFNKRRNQDLAGAEIPSEMVEDLSELLAKWSRAVQSQIKE